MGERPSMTFLRHFKDFYQNLGGDPYFAMMMSVL